MKVWRLMLAGALAIFAGFGTAAESEPASASPGPGSWRHEEVRRWKAAEANQGVAVDAEFFYAIDNHAIGKYRKTTGERVGGWNGEKEGAIKHLNAGAVLDGKLFCAHSNFPTLPEQSSVEIWDVATMRHLGQHRFENPPGSLTWAVRHGADWVNCFAHYRKTSDPARTRVVKFDAQWQPRAEWQFPAGLIDRFSGNSSSGGAFGPGGHLFVSGHDARELYVLDLPRSGTELTWSATIPISAAGQAFAWDEGTPGVLYSIDRKAREVIVSWVTDGASAGRGKRQAAEASMSPRLIEADVCIYGGTSGGVVAAVQAARMGKKTVIMEPGRHLGGMTAGGLSAVDVGDPRSVGGIAREYFTALSATVGTTLAWDKPFESKGGGPATGGAYAIEPHKAEMVFVEMARAANVAVHFQSRLAQVKKDGARIAELTMENGVVVRAKMFIDATYEGDLMAKAGVSYTLMREGNAKYGETYNGIHYSEKYLPRTNHLKPGPNGRVKGGQGVWDRDFLLDPYRVPGDSRSGLLPLVQEGDPGTPGEAAPGVQAYCFRLCLTTNPDRLPIAPPPNYDAGRYELIARFIATCQAIGDDMDLRWFSKYDALPNGKWDFNTATFGANLPGASWEWPEASYARREEIAREHENYHRGLLHFLATDPRVPAKVRDEVKRFGLPRDEFTDNGGWPHQLYIREARRMVSDLVLTEHHTFGREVAANSVGLGSYGTDTHEIRRIVRDGVVIREGKTAGSRGGAPPYPIGYAAIVPRAAECENLFVTFALSASHTAFSSIRMEPVFMVTSQSAATAASLAIDGAVPVQKVDQMKLRQRLLADGQVLDWQAAAKPATSSKP